MRNILRLENLKAYNMLIHRVGYSVYQNFTDHINALKKQSLYIDAMKKRAAKPL